MFSKLEFGLQRPLSIREERVDLDADLSLLYMSDLHLRRGNAEFLERELLESLERTRPQVLLLGGDLVDDRAGLEVLGRLVERGLDFAQVGAVSGNHDFLVGRSTVRDTVLQAGGQWLEDSWMECGKVRFLGCPAQEMSSERNVLCSHYPTDFSKARRRGIDLVLAGHLHGWQIVFGQWGEYLFPGALLSRWNGLKFERGTSTLLVSRGVTDLFPLRWNCPREVVRVEI